MIIVAYPLRGFIPCPTPCCSPCHLFHRSLPMGRSLSLPHPQFGRMTSHRCAGRWQKFLTLKKRSLDVRGEGLAQHAASELSKLKKFAPWIKCPFQVKIHGNIIYQSGNLLQPAYVCLPMRLWVQAVYIWYISVKRRIVTIAIVSYFSNSAWFPMQAL